MKAKIDINKKGNGACPMCTHEKFCFIRNSIADALKSVDSTQQEHLELVIYECPRFEET